MIYSACTQKKLTKHSVKQATIDAFNELQKEVLDKLVSVNAKNGKMIAENSNASDEFKQAYDDYRVLIARLEHFSIGVKEKIYDFEVVNELAGQHLIYVYKKVKPIIEKANDFSDQKEYYKNFVDLVKKLDKKQPKSRL